MGLGAILAGSAVLGGIGLLGQKKANEANKDIASAQTAFQDEMSRTQYQRGVEDMKKAGLNPALSYSQGGNASPSGATTRVENEAGKITEAMMQSINYQKVKQDINTAKAQENSLNATANRTNTLTPSENANIQAQAKSHITTAEYGSPLKTAGDAYEKAKTAIFGNSKELQKNAPFGKAYQDKPYKMKIIKDSKGNLY